MLSAMVETNELRQATQVTSAAPNVTISNVTSTSGGVISYLTTITPAVAPPAPAPAKKLVHASRLFEYYATRKIEGTINEDSGATIRDTIKAAVQYGVVDESLWPYDIKKFAVNPPVNVWTVAASHKVTSYHAISDGDTETMKSALVGGYLVGFGFQVYSYFLSREMSTKAFLNRPGSNETIEGGHAICLVGYSDSKKAFLVRNSWSTAWGLAGYFWMAYDYVADSRLSSDFWVINSRPIG